MYVTKRNGNKEPVQFDKITTRISKLTLDLGDSVDPVIVTQKTVASIFSGITTTELDNQAALICMNMITENPGYGILGGRIAVSNHQKNTPENFSEAVRILSENIDIQGNRSPLVSEELIKLSEKYKDEIQGMIDFNRDYDIDFFGFKTLERSYLLRININGGKDRKIIERPQHLFMRVALGLHGDDLELVKKTYDYLSLKYIMCATPTLFNCGTPIPQLASCFLTGVEDSIEGIFDSYRECGIISKWAGGLGVAISNIRSKGSYIRRTGGKSGGILPLIKSYNSIALQFDQGGRRMGSFAMYLSPYHADIFSFLEARKNTGSESERARDLFYALFVPDIFMEKIEKDEDWYLLDPDQSTGLDSVYGYEFNELYNRYVLEGKFVKKIKARELWQSIIASQIETGMPYLTYKDAVNRKSNQKNVGTIKSSNLCVSGDTMILTKEGYFPIKTLENEMVEVWNGNEWSKTCIKKTGENQKLLTLNFSNGMTMKCTEYHKFYIETGSRPAQKSRPVVVEAKDLKSNMKIIRFDLPKDLIDNGEGMIEPYTHGFYCGDGTDYNKKKEPTRCLYKTLEKSDFCGLHQKSYKEYEDNDGICKAQCFLKIPLLSLYHDKILLIDHLKYKTKGSYNEKLKKITLCLPSNIEDKYFVPLNKGISTKIRWLEGYLDADGCVIKYNEIKNIQVISIHEDFLTNVFYLLQTLGVQSSIGVSKEAGTSLLPDGKGGNKLYNTKKNHRLNIDANGVIRLVDLGFNPKRLNISDVRPPHHITNRFIKINEVIDNNDIEDTYCFNEPKEHKGVFNGIITGNCNEITLYSDKNETAVCNLSSISLPSVLEYPNASKLFPWFSLLNTEEKELVEHVLNGELKLLSTENCVYCKLLKTLLKKTKLSYIEIDSEEAERLRLLSKPTHLSSKPFQTFPQLISVNEDDIRVLGGYDDCWKILKPRINHEKLAELSSHLTLMVNKMIDITFYPVEKARTSNLRHRPLGLGISGLANVFMELRLPFTSDEAKKINKEIFETIYFGAHRKSNELAKEFGSYLSEGNFQFNLWDLKDEDLSGRWNWGKLREDIFKYGSRNSMLTSCQPTASSASIIGNNESFEMITSNLYTRNVLSGVFTIINKHLIRDLISMNLWSNEMKEKLIYLNGSVQDIKEIPKFFRDIYKTTFEVDQREMIKMSADRAPFISHSQSLNLFFDKPSFKLLTSCHFYGWKLGLKTGSYYIRTKPSRSGEKFGLDATKEKELRESIEKNKIEEEAICLSCSS